MTTKDHPRMSLTASVTKDNQISIGLRREGGGEIDQADISILTPMETRAYASILISRAELAERRVRLAKTEP